MSRFAATLRIARRDARRAKGRSALVIAMIALPVLGVGAADVAARTFELSAEQQAARTLGTADVVLEDTGQQQVVQSSYGGYASEGVRARTGPADVRTALPAGARAVVDARSPGDVAVPGRRTSVELRSLPLADPLAKGIYSIDAGREVRAVDEVAVSLAVADRLSLSLGDRVSLRLRGDDTELPRTVVGIARDASRTDTRAVLVHPDLLAGGARGLETSVRYLVDLPAAPVWADVERGNAVGFLVSGRSQIPGGPPEPPPFDDPVDAELVAVIVLVVGMALLEVVLLAGPAFAVGTKRQARELALLAASGGERSDVRRTVLSSGIVLGAVGAALGIAGAIALGAGALPLMTRLTGDRPGPFEVRWPELLGVALVGVVAAVLAAVLPARTAGRQDVVAALTGRRGTLRSSRAVPVLGLLAAAAGAGLALYGARHRQISLVLAGSALAELGLVATTPTLVGLAGRLGPLLPVAPRLALRDASRNRGRTAPAVSAILAAVAGSVAVATYVASLDRHDEQAYQASAPSGAVLLPFFDRADASKVDRAEAAMRRALPDHDVVRMRSLQGPFDGSNDVGYVDVAQLPEKLCPAYSSTGPLDELERRRIERTDPRCTQRLMTPGVNGVLVGDGRLLAAVSGHRGPAYDDVLARGGAVVPALSIRPDGTADVRVLPPARPDGTVDEAAVRTVRVEAVGLPDEGFQVAVLSPAAAAKLGRPVSVVGVVASGPVPTTAQEDALRAAVDEADLLAVPTVERGYVSDYGLGLIALALGAAVIVLGASGIATGLAAADARADLSTLAAVGASPGVRRRLAAFQSAVTAGLGTLLGVVAGMVPAVGLLLALNQPPDGAPPGFSRPDPFEVVVPWLNLAVTGLAVPLLAALAAAALTRSRLPLVRRVA